NAYFDTHTRSLTLTVSDPVGKEVQTPPCFAQNEQVQARAGISDGSGRQSSANEILPQWQRPEINMCLIRSVCCARAASGHAAAPPSSVMNVRRFTARCLPCFRPKG